jgi:ABC-2 type transport system permease protein
LAGYFISPIAYIVGALFIASSSWYFFEYVFQIGNEASLRDLFNALAYIMVFIVPLLTMRLLSEEYRGGTIETLMTAPVTEVQVILGKFLGVLGFYAVLLVTTAVPLILLSAYGQPDGGVAFVGYLGMLLLGAAYLAVGIFASTLTPYQLLAAVIGAGILALLGILMQLIVMHASPPWNLLASHLNAMSYFSDFSRGVFDSRGLVYFVGVAALFLFLSIKALESHRWR